MQENKKTKIKILGIGVSIIRQQTLLKRVKEQLDKKQQGRVIVNANPEILVRAYKNASYRQLLNSADIVMPDGIGVVLALRILYGVRVHRIAGVDLAYQILRLAAQENKSVFLLGATTDANEKATQNLRKMNNELRINGLGGKFTQEEVIKEIQILKPDILLVALGSPHQEELIHSLASRFKPHIPSIIMPVGGAFDFWAYPSLRAPKFLQRIGLEWLWRFIRQPWRLTRIINAVIVFPVLLIKDRLSRA